ncbi:hypothetical protein PUH89_04705 [Rhodobacter capsulatus]|uniref:Uncharacterized protein n=1 Tax=Rhodobacter capsulatus TaxID=1061 RepID=A0A1G7IS02_RHOCA|nr:hypothetical protein [Rhodobacter capsulatus]WER10303.1 hypothetical protein PUH89_04705 [Rhodobacter capsulatus]SDF15512.1 hypothetical protein SAMN04244550_01777 [Rhodobacter capsulatus]
MIFHTPILTLLLVSALAALVAVWSAGFGISVLRHWDLSSGARGQLLLERRTELVSTLFALVMAAEAAALFLFVFNADRMAALFVGAMCAVGTLNANGYGFPALYGQIASFFAAAVWLVLDHVDRLGRDYPLTRVKYAAVLVIAPLVLLTGALQLAYFLNLRSDVITSCCSKLFTPANAGISDEMAAVDPALALAALALAGGLVLASGVQALRTGRGHGLFALAGAGYFGAALLAMVSTIALYVYENPNHHCPFCILKPDYGYIGYAFYLPLFGATALALGLGAVSPFTARNSLRTPLPAVMRRLTFWALAGFAAYGAVTVWVIARSNLILFG